MWCNEPLPPFYIRNTFILLRLIDRYVISARVFLCYAYHYAMHSTAHKIYACAGERWCKQISIFHSKSIMNFGVFVEKSQCQPDSSTAQSLKVISLIFKFQFLQCYTHWWATSIWLMLLPPPPLLLLRLLVILRHSKKLVSTRAHTRNIHRIYRTAFNFDERCHHFSYSKTEAVQIDAIATRQVCTHMCVYVWIWETFTNWDTFLDMPLFCSCHSDARVAEKNGRQKYSKLLF